MFQDTNTGKTHFCCGGRFKEEWGLAKHCEREPHNNCELKDTCDCGCHTSPSSYEIYAKQEKEELGIIIKDKKLLELIDLLAKKYNKNNRAEMLVFGLLALKEISKINHTITRKNKK